jgi:UDP-N-acetylglucosamine pyrophosphorylase
MPLLEQEIARLAPIVTALKAAPMCSDKRLLLEELPCVKKFLAKAPEVCAFLAEAASEEGVVILSLIAAGQGERILEDARLLSQLAADLLPAERFYAFCGGLVGYHYLVLQLLESERFELAPLQDRYEPPRAVDISEEEQMRVFIARGIEELPHLAEIYPLGGAADRLRLQDERTGAPLPAARLPFKGKTLLEGMIADVQAREYLYYKLFGSQVITPVAVMTSLEKDNDAHVRAICEENEWFGRPRASFRFFCQPSVPAVTRGGMWCLQGPMKPLLKPGGHGVLWKLAQEAGVFSWLQEEGRRKCLVRQINNPVAGVDYGLLAFAGLGFALDQEFGFASCPRQVKAAEGVNVLLQRGGRYALTNIEYCDFKKYRIADEPAQPTSAFSKFPSNTNLLFVDLAAVQRVVERCPLPGMIVNPKIIRYRDDQGVLREEEAGRLESMMQNIAELFDSADPAELKSFLTHHVRHKTISTAKREFVLGASLLETPEGCYMDVLKNARELLAEHCGMQVPELHAPAAFFASGPSFLFHYHPALGPLYSIIAQKVRGGKMAFGSELQLEIAEVVLEEVTVEGSLVVQADAIMGTRTEGDLRYSEETGKCVLRRVTVRNAGIDREAPNVFWRHEIARQGCCHISICGDGEFYAEDVVLEGSLRIDVAPGTRVSAVLREGELVWITERLERPTWHWNYALTDDCRIALNLSSAGSRQSAAACSCES